MYLSSSLQTEARGYITCGHLVTVESLGRITRRTIFLWNFIRLSYQTLGRGHSHLSKAIVEPSGQPRVSSPKAVHTSAGADLLRDWMSLVCRDLLHNRAEKWRLPGREPRAAFTPCRGFSLLYKWFSKPFLEIVIIPSEFVLFFRICYYTMLFSHEEEFWRNYVFLGGQSCFCKWLVRFISFQCCFFCWQLRS